MLIPLVDLQVQFQSLKLEIMAEIEGVLESMQLFLGPQNQAFENEFAQYCACNYGIGLSSGTDALALALTACDIGQGDEVITVANTFIATVEAIAMVGATPVFIDIDPNTYTMDWKQLDHVLTPRTRAIIPVHLFGHPVDMAPVLDFARKHQLRVIEDASQAHGASYQGQRVGSVGDIGCFSFYFSKNLGAYGEAGACVTNDAKLAVSIRKLRDHGSLIRYQHEILGVNARLDEIQAAVLRVKLRYLDQWNAARQAHASFYTEQMQGIVDAVPLVRSWATHVFYAYVVQVQDRDSFRKALEQEGIATSIHYPTPIHLQPACSRYGYKRGMLPETEAAAARIVSLPMYPELTIEQTQRVVNVIKRSIVSGIVGL
jgi:dTDP-4-amino-4,6-dideoxygalactose transaminase